MVVNWIGYSGFVGGDPRHIFRGEEQKTSRWSASNRILYSHDDQWAAFCAHGYDYCSQTSFCVEIEF